MMRNHLVAPVDVLACTLCYEYFNVYYSGGGKVETRTILPFLLSYLAKLYNVFVT